MMRRARPQVVTRRAFLSTVAMSEPAVRAWAASAGDRCSFALLDVATGSIFDGRWPSLDRAVPVGSLIKPFTALAYGRSHAFVYPAFACGGSRDGCWLPEGHGTVGVEEAVAGSCNVYFQRLAERLSSDAFAATLDRFGLPQPSAVTTRAMVGFGRELTVAPTALARAYIDLASRAVEPGVQPILNGMAASSRAGTGRAIGAAVGAGGALVKTGTAPCAHRPAATSDGYVVALYPADRPRIALIAQSHGRTGADTAALGAEVLARSLAVR